MGISVKGHVLAVLLGVVLDLLLGDPYQLPHPIRWIGREISLLERLLYREEDDDRSKRKNGALLVVIVCATAVLTSGLLLLIFGAFGTVPGILMEAGMTYYLLAARCLQEESGKVYAALKRGNLEESRLALSMIVGRDTEVLEEDGIVRAAVETVAENTSDGVLAPLFYCMLGGPVLGFFYKATNTMDSMLGYQNARYLYFGRTAAKLDDLLNFIPSRLCALLMLGSSFWLSLGDRHFDGREALRIFRRDRYRSKSPNAGQTESVVAGALGVQLLGPASYFGNWVEKPTMGDARRAIEPEDIRRSWLLMYGAELLCLLLWLLSVLLSGSIVV